MKKIIFSLLLISSLSSMSFGSESPCRTDGCVSQKNLQMSAVFNWIATNDDCTSAVSWLQSLKKLNDTQFQLICGDTSDREEIIVETKFTSDFEVEVKRIK